MDTNREKIKSILTCLDEEDYEQALRELDYLPAIITSISLFISGIVFLSRKQWNKAAKIFEDLSNKLDPNASDEEYVLFCFIQSLRNIIHWKKGTESGVYELNEKRMQSLSLKNINMEDIKSTFLILKGIRAIKEMNNNEFSTIIEMLNSPNLGLIEQPIVNVKSTELFSKYYSEEHQIFFLLSLLSSELIKRIVYLLYINAAYDVFKSANTEEQKRILQRIYDLIKRIEPRIDNSEHSIPIFYKMLKRTYNEWTFSWFISQRKIEEGFAWLESNDNGKGMDFLRVIEQDPNPQT
jgi:hypothetical protein